MLPLFTTSGLEEAVASVLLYDRLEDQSNASNGSEMDGCLLLGPVRDFSCVSLAFAILLAPFAFVKSPSWLEESCC